MGVKDPTGVIVQHGLAILQTHPRVRPRRSPVSRSWRASPEAFQVHVVLFKLCIGVVACGDFLGDLALKIPAFVNKLNVGLVTVGFEPGQNLGLLPRIKRHGFQNDRLALRLGDIILQHFQLADVIRLSWAEGRRHVMFCMALKCNNRYK